MHQVETWRRSHNNNTAATETTCFVLLSCRFRCGNNFIIACDVACGARRFFAVMHVALATLVVVAACVLHGLPLCLCYVGTAFRVRCGGDHPWAI
jgi:hypothetical protein